MKYLFLLSKGNLDLACAEILNLAKHKSHNLIDNILVLDCSKKEIEFLSKRLAYTRVIMSVLFICEEINLINEIKKFNWRKHNGDSFCVRIIGRSKHNEGNLGKIIKEKSKSKVNLTSPATLYNFLFFRNIVAICKLEFIFEENFRSRKAHKRPRNHPSSLDPKLARSLLNLSGIRSGKIVDPMSGTGGILIEASLMGLKSVGYDTDPEMIKRATENLKYLKIEDFKLQLRDALKLNKIDYLVVDLPYGRNTKNMDLANFYIDFLKNLKLGKRGVVVFPKIKNLKINYDKILSKFKIKNEFEIYIHKTLSKKIFVIEP